MRLNYNQIENLNNTRNYILKYFSKEKILEIQCKHCNGTGLFYYDNNGFKSWDTESYCDYCGGTGFIDGEININNTWFRCNECKGSGFVLNLQKGAYNDSYSIQCKKCNGTGFMDWIGNILR